MPNPVALYLDAGIRDQKVRRGRRIESTAPADRVPNGWWDSRRLREIDKAAGPLCFC